MFGDFILILLFAVFLIGMGVLAAVLLPVPPLVGPIYTT